MSVTLVLAKMEPLALMALIHLFAFALMDLMDQPAKEKVSSIQRDFKSHYVGTPSGKYLEAALN